MLSNKPTLQFPTSEHADAADVIRDYFTRTGEIDTVLVVNSCARGQAVAESDLDFAILARNGIQQENLRRMEGGWEKFSQDNSAIQAFKSSSKFHQLHLDIIEGNYEPTVIELGAAPDYFELEIGNQVCYSAALGKAGEYFNDLRSRWLPYYSEGLRNERHALLKESCRYDLDHIPRAVSRGLYFQAFHILSMALQKYLQILFLQKRTYPIAYNKWIKYQVVEILGLPEIYKELPGILSISDLESNEIVQKATALGGMLEQISEL